MAVRAGNTGERRNSLPVSDDEDGSQHERSADDAQHDADTDNEQHPAYSYHDNDFSLVIAEKTRVSDLVTLRSPNVGALKIQDVKIYDTKLADQTIYRTGHK